MTKMEVYSLAQDTLLKRYDLALAMVHMRPSAENRAYRARTMEKIMELRSMMLEERNRRMNEAEQKQQHKQKNPVCQIVIEYSDGNMNKINCMNKNAMMESYSLLKDLMGTIPGSISRVSIIYDGKTIRSYEQGEF